MDHPQFLTAKDLLNYAFCERIIHFEHVLRIPQHTTKKEIAGRKAHKTFNDKSHRLILIPGFDMLPRYYNLFLEDTELGFRTILDCVLVDNKTSEAFVIQVKNSSKPGFIYRGQRLQLIAEAYLVRKKMGLSVGRAYVKYLLDGALLPVRVGVDTEAEFFSALLRMRELIRTEILPEPTEMKKRCTDCCYLKLCRRI